MLVFSFAVFPLPLHSAVPADTHNGCAGPRTNLANNLVADQNWLSARRDATLVVVRRHDRMGEVSGVRRILHIRRCRPRKIGMQNVIHQQIIFLLKTCV